MNGETLRHIIENLREVDIDTLAEQSLALQEMIVSRHGSVFVWCLVLLLLILGYFSYFLMMANLETRDPRWIKKKKLRIIGVALILPVIVQIAGGVLINFQLDDFFFSNIDNENKNSFYTRNTEDIPNLRYYLFSEKNRISVNRDLNEKILPDGYAIEPFDISQLLSLKDPIKDQFVAFSKSKLWGKALLIFLLSIAGIIGVIFIKFLRDKEI